MSEELELIANSLFDNQVPKIWDQKGFLSMKPLASWTEDLNNRINFLQEWIDHGTPKHFWISGKFRLTQVSSSLRLSLPAPCKTTRENM